jgi:hypothetical protein
MKYLFLTLALAVTAHAAPPEKFWGALHQIETGGALGAIKGDYVNGKPRALGPYQIHRAYFKDSAVKGDYSQCADLAFSRKVVTAYLKLYAPKAWAAGDCNVLFRTHNGGPAAMRATGTTKKNLDRYSKKALGLMK